MMTNLKKTISSLVIGSSMITGGALAGDSMIDPYTSTETTFEIAEQSVTESAGENKVVISKDSPEVTFSKWDSEADFSVKYTDVVGEGSRPFFSDRIEWGSGSKEVHAYPLDASASVGEDGGFEIEVVLNEVPESNVFSFEINGAEEYDFFYQPELTEEEIASGAFRPENVVGSYAVYHKTNKDHVIGGANYATGKAYHIYRPKAIDANNVETWGELNIENGILTVTIPTEYLASAEYPVKVDPTFGYTSAGASSSGANGNLKGSVFTAPAQNGVISKNTIYCNANVSIGADSFIYAGSAGDANTLLASNSSTGTALTTPSWIDVPITYSFTASTTYWLVGDGATGFSLNVYYDAGSTNQGLTGGSGNPLTGETYNARANSIYATYTSDRRIIIGQ